MSVSAPVRTEWVEYPSGGITVRAYLALPDGRGPWPTAIMVHENPGLTEHRQDVTRRLAAEGFAVLTPNLYCRVGDQQPQGAEAIARATPDEQVFADVMAGYAYLRGRPEARPDRTGLYGICMGGSKAFYTACHSNAFRCLVDLYGAIRRLSYGPSGPEQSSYLPLVPQLSCPIQYHVGDQDHVCPMVEVEALREALARHGKEAEFYVYPGAVHAFHDDTLPERYHPAAAALFWERAVVFLHRHLGG